MLPNPYIILGTAGAWLASIVLCGWLMYARGHDDMRNAFTEQQLTQANTNLRNSQHNQNISAKAGADHDRNTTQVNVDTSAIARALRDTLSKIPAATDPVVAVWVIRMFDRAASRSVNADPYPGKSPGDPSDFKLSEVIAMLADNFGRCELNRVQLSDIIKLKPVLPAPPPEEKHGIFDKLNPFQ